MCVNMCVCMRSARAHTHKPEHTLFSRARIFLYWLCCYNTTCLQRTTCAVTKMCFSRSAADIAALTAEIRAQYVAALDKLASSSAAKMSESDTASAIFERTFGALAAADGTVAVRSAEVCPSMILCAVNMNIILPTCALCSHLDAPSVASPRDQRDTIETGNPSGLSSIRAGTSQCWGGGQEAAAGHVF